MNKRFRKWLLAAAVLAACAGPTIQPHHVVEAAEVSTVQTGWVQDEGGYRYQLEDGSFYVTGKAHWKSIEGKMYYILADGHRKTGALTLNGKKYFMDKDGVRVTGWMQSPKNPGVWYYYDPKWGNAATGSRNIKGKYYYFRSSGVRVNGFFKYGRNVYITDPNTGVALRGLQKAANGNTYFLDKKGHAYANFQKTGKNEVRYFDPVTRAMKTGKMTLNGKIYLLRSNGVRHTGWYKTKSSWYYFDPKSGAAFTGFHEIAGSTYYFKSNGIAVRGFQSIAGNRYYFDKTTREMYRDRRPVIIDGKYYDIPTSGVVSPISEGRYYAEQTLNRIGWSLSAAFRYSAGLDYASFVPEPSASEDFAEHYARFGFTHGYGHCYVYAGTFYEMAKALGYDAHFVKGYVPSARGGWVTHGWVEITQANGTYIFDANYQHQTGSNGYYLTYATGAWTYANYHRIN